MIRLLYKISTLIISLFKKYILKQKQVIGLYRISGSYDYLINVLAKDINDFDKFYQNLIENIEADSIVRNENLIDKIYFHGRFFVLLSFIFS